MPLSTKRIKALVSSGRRLIKASSGDDDLGPLKLLPGKWKSLPGRGWNMIALPHAESNLHYRLLLNQYNEKLKFNLVDKGVANRGITDGQKTDQIVVALDYEQHIKQIVAEDFPASGLAGKRGLDIHHEPGLFLFMTNFTTDGWDLARLASIPHGDSVLALGKDSKNKGKPRIPDINGLPIGVDQNLDSKYLAPYKHFHEHPFRGLFDPTIPNALLRAANQGVDILRTTTLDFKTSVETAGIKNIPFIVKQADATEMHSTFWIQELADKDRRGRPKLRMQYSQTVFLDFFERKDWRPGRIRWPHVSINTLEKI